jgi:hypothetical protein
VLKIQSGGQTRDVIRIFNYSNIQIIKLTLTVRRIFALFKEFNVCFSTFFDLLFK